MVTTSGLVLAGGSSSRMGTDKALLRVEGVRLVDRSVAALRPVCGDVVVARGSRPIPELVVPQVPDTIEGVGPLGGLASGLAVADHRLVMVLAVDLPTPDVGLLQALADRWAGAAAVVPSAAGRPQPLHAVWARSAAAELTVLLGEGVRSVMQALDTLGAVVLDELETAALVDHDRWATNINRPSDVDPGHT